MRPLHCLLLATAVAVAGSVRGADDPARFVDPYVGCADNGHCFAAATCPFGLVQAGPDTGYTWWDYCSGYRYRDTRILGFSQTHVSGMGCGDLGDVLIMPFTGAVDLTRTNYASCYRKETQTATPGFYEVTLDDNRAKVAIAAAPHAAIYRIDYAGAQKPRLFVDLQYGILNWTIREHSRRVLNCDIRREGDRVITGTLETQVWIRRSYSFRLEFDRPIAEWTDLPKRSPAEKGRRFVLGFDLPAGQPLLAKVAISTRSEAGAKRNLAAEIPDWNLTRVAAAARASWNAVLAKMSAEGSTVQLKTFYTCLYHLFIQPTDLADAGEGHDYSNFSLWDTFRAAQPLYTIIIPERVDDFVNSILAHYDRQGYMPVLPVWGKDTHCMIGNHSIPVVVDAYLKGFRGFDAERAYAAIRKSLTENIKGRPFNSMDVWQKYGYFPFDLFPCETVSRTLEHAYDDWCAGRLAAALGKTADAEAFARRGANWTNVFDRAVGFARGRDSKGGWRTPFSPFKLNVGGGGTGAKDFTEGNSWQYTWHVMQDPEGLIAAMGGKKPFVAKLDGLFAQPEKVEGMGFALDATGLIGQYAHGNEPSHHTAYFYPFAGRGDRTAEIVREICDRFYRPEPEGLCGNDDCGQMSAWYLFSAMGFYPFNPCGGDYVIGAPQVPKVTLALPGGKRLVIVAENLSKANKYVERVTLNGRRVEGFTLRHADLMKGGELVFTMRPKLDPVRHVRTEMGTVNTYGGRNACAVSTGNLYPMTARPWAFCGWTPQTRADGTSRWFYDYTDERLFGIRQTRQPSPWIGDHGSWTLLPVTGPAVGDAAKRASWYSHKAETRGPDRYGAYLADYDVSVTLAPAAHGAMARVTYPKSDLPGLVVNPLQGGAARLDADGRGVTGLSVWNANRRNSGAPVRMRFVVRFSRKAVRAETQRDGALHVFFAPTAAGDALDLRMASSLISDDQALANLAETDGHTVETLAAEARAEWNERLCRVRVASDDPDAVRTFYTCFYRTMLFPMSTWETARDGRPLHWSPATGETRPGRYYSGTGFWDTFRALFPLLNLLAPEMNAQMMEGLENCWHESGWLPEWSAPGLSDCMIGNNSASVVADAWLSGVRGAFDIHELWKALVHGAHAAHPKLRAVGRFGVEAYDRLGYVPRDAGVNESAARTLEYAYDDWCIARLGAALGKPADEVAAYARRAGNWRNVFDPARKIACGRNADGSFNRDFNPFAWGGDFTEGCAHHYTWSVFHDVPGLMAAMGGETAFEARLDEIFTLPPTCDCAAYRGIIHEAREMQIMGMGQYAHGNQPIQHVIYLYDWCGAWSKAQRRAREVMDRFYRPTPDGYCGDEDNGQTSAWYVWSALGMYPVCPGSGECALGAPRFDAIDVTLPNGRLLEIRADGAGEAETFRSASHNGRALEKPFVSRDALAQGGELTFTR